MTNKKDNHISKSVNVILVAAIFAMIFCTATMTSYGGPVTFDETVDGDLLHQDSFGRIIDLDIGVNPITGFFWRDLSDVPCPLTGDYDAFAIRVPQGM